MRIIAGLSNGQHRFGPLTKIPHRSSSRILTPSQPLLGKPTISNVRLECLMAKRLFCEGTSGSKKSTEAFQSLQGTSHQAGADGSKKSTEAPKNKTTQNAGSENGWGEWRQLIFQKIRGVWKAITNVENVEYWKNLFNSGKNLVNSGKEFVVAISTLIGPLGLAGLFYTTNHQKSISGDVVSGPSTNDPKKELTSNKEIERNKKIIEKINREFGIIPIEDFISQSRYDHVETITKTINAQHRLYINGYGGMGKTYVVKKYIENAKTQYDYVIFIDATPKKNSKKTEKEILEDRLKDFKDCVGEELANFINNKRELKGLIVLDNIDNKDSFEPVKKLLGSGNENTDFIITGRSKFASNALSISSVTISGLDDHNAKEVIDYYYNKDKSGSDRQKFPLLDNPSFKKIINKISGRPFFAYCVAKWLKDSPITPFGKRLKELSDKLETGGLLTTFSNIWGDDDTYFKNVLDLYETDIDNFVNQTDNWFKNEDEKVRRKAFLYEVLDNELKGVPVKETSSKESVDITYLINHGVGRREMGAFIIDKNYGYVIADRYTKEKTADYKDKARRYRDSWSKWIWLGLEKPEDYDRYQRFMKFAGYKGW